MQSVCFKYTTAKALHRNLVKAPAWWFANKLRCLKSVPLSVASMVALHVRGQVEMAVTSGTTVAADSLGKEIVLEFDEDRGLSRKTGANTATTQSDDYDDESYD